MAAIFQHEHFRFSEPLKPKELREQLRDRYSDKVDQIEAEDGSDPYSGNLSTLPRKINFILYVDFDNVRAATDWIEEEHEKGNPPLAVRVSDGWVVGGWCPS